jgi:phenylacetate-coenzyme A ligase PaaK-like adenylate-forming protein
MVTTTSETLRPDLRQVIADGFGAPIVNVFGSSEGLVGVSPPDDEVITFASDSCIVEPVDADDRPVAPGVASSAVLVTNLFNHTQPLIRYRIDDRFVVRASLPGSGHLRAEVAGRASDVLRFGDVVVHPLIVASPLTRAAAVVDYQVRQTSRGVDVDVVAQGEVDTAGLAGEIERGLAAAGVASPSARVEVVDSLARNEATGKFAVFVPMPS